MRQITKTLSGKANYTLSLDGDVITPAPSPLRCSTTNPNTTEFCQFPFKVNGNLQWDCVRDPKGNPVCSVNKMDGLGRIPDFDTLDSFVPCLECDECIHFGEEHGGLPLMNHDNTNSYEGVSSKYECQTLCKLATGCNYFVFNSKEESCALLYGIGWSLTDPAYHWEHHTGPKFCPGGSFHVRIHLSDNSILTFRGVRKASVEQQHLRSEMPPRP